LAVDADDGVDVFDLLRREATNGKVELGSSSDALLFVTVPAPLPSATENLVGDDLMIVSPRADAGSDSSFPFK